MQTECAYSYMVIFFNKKKLWKYLVGSEKVSNFALAFRRKGISEAYKSITIEAAARFVNES